MEQEGHEQKQQAQPLYYIEQPALTPFSGPGQSVSIRKNIGAQKRKKHVKKRDKQPTNREENVAADSGAEEVEEEETPEEEFEDIPSNKTVAELLEYIESLPHFIQPVIACETEEKYVQGTIVDVSDGSITFQDRRNFMNTTIHEKDVTNMYIVSL